MDTMDSLFQKEFVSRCDAIFKSMNRRYLRGIAWYLNCSMDDLRQEFRLICWEAFSGNNGFDSSKGDIMGYFFGKMKTLIYKRDGYRNFQHSDDFEGLIESQSLVDENQFESSVLDKLIDDENSKESEATDQQWAALYSFMTVSMKRNVQCQSVMYRLWKCGLNQMQIAKISGRSQGYVSRVLKKEAESEICLAR